MTERDSAELDARLYGTGFLVDGKRVSPERVQILTRPKSLAEARDRVMQSVQDSLDQTIESALVTRRGGYEMVSARVVVDSDLVLRSVKPIWAWRP